MYSASNTSTSSAQTNYNSVVTAEATATATSNLNLLDAQNSAKKLATSLASEEAIFNANIINQSVNIVNQQFIQPLEKKQNTITSTDNVRLDQVIASLEAFKSSIYNVNYLADLINKNKEQIIKAGQYASVLQPIIEKKYYNQKDDDFWVDKLNFKSLDKFVGYFNNKYPFWRNRTFDEIKNYNKNNNLEKFNELLDKNIINRINVLQFLIQKYQNNKRYYYFSVIPWDNSLSLKVNLFQKDLLDDSEYSNIGARILLENFIPNTNDLSKFSPEYLNFINDLANKIESLNESELETDTIWPYVFPANIDTSTCLYSSLYPEWNGRLISECYIPGSDVEYPSIISNVINDLYLNYPPLLSGQIAMSTYNIGSTYYVSLIKIDTYNGVPCFRQFPIAINPYFSDAFLTVTNDTTINGSLKVLTYDGEPIIETDNTSKITSFYDKIGVNQNTYNVKGLVDINNVSNTVISKIVDNFVGPLLYSNNVFNDIFKTITYGQKIVTNVPVSYQQDVFIFKTVLKNIIQSTELSFVYVPKESDVFVSKKFNTDSFNKIQTIVNELNKMLPQINLNQETKSYNFSFIELLNDTKNYYLCSMRAILVRNPQNQSEIEIYFINSFLNVNDVVISDSYKKDFNNIANELSRCSRLTNFSVLLVNNENIYNELLQGNSIGSTDTNNPYLSDVINNSPYFRERFGSKGLYMFGHEFINQQQIDNNKIFKCLFHENWPYFNGKNLNELFLPENGYSVYSIGTTTYTQYINNYGTNKNLSFIVNLNLDKGPKFAVVNQIIINEKPYFIGCGFNLNDIISESIVLKGDNTVTGNLTVVDSDTNNTIFNVDTCKKQNFSLYKLGLGTDNPQSKLDIKNGGVGDIIRSIINLSKVINDFNQNIQLLKNAPSERSFENIIQTKFKNYNALTGKSRPIVQENDNFYAIAKLSDTLIGEDTTSVYDWLYPNWKNQKFKDIIVPQHAKLINTTINVYNTLYNNQNMFENSIYYLINDWTFGKKLAMFNVFNNNNKLYHLINGINLEKLGIDILDENVISFYKYITAYTCYIQDIQIRLNDIKNIPNKQKARDYRNQQLNIYPIQTLVKYTIPLNDISHMTISDYNYNTLETLNTQKYSTIKEPNLLSKLMYFYTNFKGSYSNINKDSCYVLYFEDNFSDLVSVSLCSDVSSDGNIITLISFELQLDTIIQSTVNVKGDVNIRGDAYFTTPDKTPYVFIDPENKFVGINTLETKTNYANTYLTTELGSFANNNVCIRSFTYPNTVVERISEKKDNTVVSLFSNKSTVSARRTSLLYTFDELYNNAKKYITINKNGKKNAFGTKENKYFFGPDINFEVKDITGITKEMGNIHFGIESIDSNGNMLQCFGVAAVESLEDGSVYEREILHVTNNSELQVNKISLAGNILSVDDNNNLLFNGKKVMLSD